MTAPATRETSSSRDPHLDALRGALLLLMSFDHLCTMFPALQGFGSVLAYPVGLFSMAEGFVFMAGLTTARAFVAREARGATPLYRGIGHRLFRIYRAHLFLCLYLIGLCVLKPDVFRAYEFLIPTVEHPEGSLIKSPFLLFSPPPLDVLPLYLLYIAVAPALLSLIRRGFGGVVLAASVSIWLASQFDSSLVVSMSKQGFFQGFNPIAWQVLFVAGLYFGSNPQHSRRHSSLRAIGKSLALGSSLAIIIFGFLFRREFLPFATPGWLAGFTWEYRNRLHFGLLLNFFAWAYVVHRILKRLPSPTWPMYRSFGKWWGRKSLFLFSTNIVFWMGLVVWRPSAYLPLWTQVLLLGLLLVLPVVLLMTLEALRTRSTEESPQRSGPPSRLGSIVIAIICATLPILYFPELGVPYREPKILMLWGLASIAAVLLVRSALHCGVLHFTRWHVLGTLLFALQNLSLLLAPNVGMVLQSMLVLLSLLIVSVMACNSDLSTDKVARYLAIPTTCICISLFLRIFFNISVTPQGSGLGSFVGERNSCAVFLAAMLPLFIAMTAREFHGRSSRLLYGSLTIVVTFCVVALRTRSAWWMIALYLAFSALAGIRSSQARVWRRSLALLIASLAASTLILLVTPHHMHWTSDAPYRDSLMTMASPDSSNGRLELWRLGMSIATQNPIFGVGIGNYPVVMRGYITPEIVNPQAFAFLRRDLPLFNDYLQSFVEGGLLYGILYVGLMGLAPGLMLFIALLRRTDDHVLGAAALVSCAGLSFNALFDYPFNRTETLVVYSILLAVAAMEYGRVITIPVAPRTARAALLTTITCVCTGVLGAATLAYGSSLVVRRSSYTDPDPARLALAWKLWPWDANWDLRFVDAQIAHGDDLTAQDFVNARSMSWPEDPSTFQSAALLSLHKRDFTRALDNLRRGLHENRGGRCVPTTLYLYRFLIDDPTAPAPLKAQAGEDLEMCR